MKKLFAVFGALLLVGILAVGVSAQSGSGGYFDFESSVRIMQDLLVLDDVNIQDTARIEGAVTTGADVTVGDDLTATDWAMLNRINASRATTITVAASANISPTSSYQRISSAADIGTSSIQAGTAGDILILANTGANTITLTDTATLMLPANVVLGPKGHVVLISAGADGWYALSAAVAN